MVFGYKKKILEIDLAGHTFREQGLSKDDMTTFIGGSGLNAWLLYKHQDHQVSGTDPENPLIFGAGPLVGTSFPTSARATFTAISPLTGIFGDSNGGGVFGVMVKKSGYDHLVIKGASRSPCYLVIGSGGRCHIEDATSLWGLNTLDTEKKLKKKYKGAVVASIGTAGENLVAYACIMSNNNANSFSQTGMGAVMGSKKLKAIVVLGGDGIKVKDPKGLKQFSDTVKQWTRELAFPKLFTRYGTAMFINTVTASKQMYAENWRRIAEYNDITPIDIGSYYEAVFSKDHGCFRCPLRCGKQWRIKDGPYRDEKGYGYEIAYIITLGLTLGLRDVSQILHLVNRMNNIGMDVKEFSGAVGMAIDAFKKGIITQDTSDGLTLDWGDVQLFDTLIDKIAQKEGFGKILALGTRKAAQKIGNGAQNYAMHMKGMHWPGNSIPPAVLAFSTSTRGGDFLKGVPHLIMQQNNKNIAKALFDAAPATFDLTSNEAKGRVVWWHENYKMLLDSLGVCFYLSQTLLSHGFLLPDHLAKAFRFATGVDMDGKELMIGAERGYQIEKAINCFRGLNRKDDAFTRRPEKKS
ncbi:MAG: hypothetical protein MI862_04635, partial [Desulfobacterales bacterium]|nr:hypothetical protein [Desulfobacterales bacterium]